MSNFFAQVEATFLNYPATLGRLPPIFEAVAAVKRHGAAFRVGSTGASPLLHQALLCIAALYAVEATIRGQPRDIGLRVGLE
jgi:hypothetical protein